MELLTDPAVWASFATLVVLEIVLGVDNVIFISIVSNRLPEAQRGRARRIGLLGALGLRIVLLASIAWIVSLSEPFVYIGEFGLSWRDVILLAGGLFLIYKAATEIHAEMEGEEPEAAEAGGRVTFAGVIGQIILLDLVFSIDSVITAVGVADGHLQIDAGDTDWWFDTEQAPFVYQTICGPFSLVTRVSADIGPHQHHGIGVVIRSLDEPHDWVMYSLGHQQDPGTIETRLWTYLDGVQSSNAPTGAHAEASGKLAVCRTASDEFLFADDVDGAAPSAYPEPANDFGFGHCVQVGFTVHEWWASADDPTVTVRGLVDYLHTQPVVTGPDGCRDVAAWGS